MSRKVIRRLCVLSAVASAAIYAGAATHTWNGSQIDGNWGRAGNWTPSGIPAFDATTDLIFYGSGAGWLTNNYLQAARTVQSITFNSSAASDVTIGLRTSGTTGLNLTFAGTSHITVESGSAGNFTFGDGYGGVVLDSNLAVNHNGSGSLTLSRAVSGSGALTKTGSGTLFLSLGNSFSGGLNLNGGTLSAGNLDNRLGAENGAVSFNGGTLRFTGAGSFTTTDRATTLNAGGGTIDVSAIAAPTITWAGLIDGTGGLTKNGVGALELTRANTFSGDMVVNAGKLVLANDEAIHDLARLILDSSAALDLDFTGAVTVSGLSLNGGVDWLSLGTYDAADLSLQGGGTYGGIGSITVIPEPATIGMLGLGALIMMAIRRRRFANC